MNSILGWISIFIMAVAFLGLPVYLLFLTFSSKKVDQLIKKETTGFNTIAKK